MAATGTGSAIVNSAETSQQDRTRIMPRRHYNPEDRHENRPIRVRMLVSPERLRELVDGHFRP